MTLPNLSFFHKKSRSTNLVTFARATTDTLLQRTNEYVGRLRSSTGGHAIAAYRCGARGNVAQWERRFTYSQRERRFLHSQRERRAKTSAGRGRGGGLWLGLGLGLWLGLGLSLCHILR